MIHLTYGVGIQTHDLLNLSLIPKSLDQGSRPIILINLANKEL